MAIEYSDGVIQGGDNMPAEIADFIKEQGIELLEKDEDFDAYVESVNKFYDKIDA